MFWWRMVRVALRLAWPHLLTPWRSALLRWRIETYGITDERESPLHADDLTPSHVLTFAVQRRAELYRFLGCPPIL